MVTTILPKKSIVEDPTATNDEHLAVLVLDPNMPQFRQNGFSVGTTNVNMSSSNTPMLTGAGNNAAQNADVLVSNDNTDWINKKWRPMMGWVYMVTCVTDFVIFPVLWSVFQAVSNGSVTTPWQPITLQGAGLYHVAMGAVLGIAAYGRTKEKVAGAA